MLGAIIGDIVGSIYEFKNIKTKEFLFFSPQMYFTDDTVMTVAVFEALRKCRGNWKKLEELTIQEMQRFGRFYPLSSQISYGRNFACWLKEKNPKPYDSFGNGSAMRISPIAYFAKDIEEVRILSRIISSVSHNHPEGIKGAEATAVAIFLAKNKRAKEEIRNYIKENYYNLKFTLDEIRPTYEYNETCPGTVPQAIVAFLESENFEDAIRNGISLGGDSDTLCAITGAIAEAYYGIPKELKDRTLYYLDERIKKKLEKFNTIFR